MPPSMYSPPRSLHHSMQIFHCWKQCCWPPSDSLFISSVAFSFTASTDPNLVRFNADLNFGNKKSHMGLGQVRRVDVPTRWSCASQKRLDRQGGVCRRVVLVKNPWAVLPHFRSSSSHPFTKVCQNLLVVDLVKGLTFRHPVHVNSPSDVDKNNHHCSKFGYALPCFPLLWWTGALPVHGLALTFWVVLKRPRFITSYYVL